MKILVSDNIPEIRIFFKETAKRDGDSGTFLDEVLYEYCGVPEYRCVCRKESGKPYLSGGGDSDASAAPFFSVTHTKGLWLCAVSDCPIGVDAEWAERRLHQPQQAAQRFFSPAEREWLSLLSQKIRRDSRESEEAEKEAFLRLWTRKEAYLKLLGKGIFRDASGKCSVSDDRIRFPDSSFWESELQRYTGQKIILSVCCKCAPGKRKELGNG